MPSGRRDSIHRCLANECRRAVIDYLRGVEEGSASLDDLIDHVLEQTTNAPPSDRVTVTYELYHVHLPMLDNHGIVDFDPRTEVARYRTHSEIERAIEEE